MRHLQYYTQRDLTFRFVSNIDGTDFAEATRDLDAGETLFIISSKTFTTLETMTNAHSARDWALKTLKDPAAVARHFVAVSTNAEEVAKLVSILQICLSFGIGVGGRYSMVSAIGLSTMIAIGPEHFRAMLDVFTRWMSISALPRSNATCRCLWDCWVFGITTFSMHRPLQFFRMSST